MKRLQNKFIIQVQTSYEMFVFLFLPHYSAGEWHYCHFSMQWKPQLWHLFPEPTFQFLMELVKTCSPWKLLGTETERGLSNFSNDKNPITSIVFWWQRKSERWPGQRQPKLSAWTDTSRSKSGMLYCYLGKLILQAAAALIRSVISYPKIFWYNSLRSHWPWW